MAVHVPIGLLVGLGAWEVWRVLVGRVRPRSARINLGGGAVFWAWLAALGAAGSIGTGLLHEPAAGGGDSIALHKWLGIGVGVGCIATAILASIARTGSDGAGRWRERAYRTVLFLTIAALIPAGHLGGSITHGEGYLIEPLIRSTTGPAPPAAGPGGGTVEGPVGTVVPSGLSGAEVLAMRCGSCHGARQSRGGLRLHTTEAMLAGGESGPAMVPGDAAASLVVRRMLLPLDDRLHMPPRTRAQPTAEEIRAVESWIRSLGEGG